VVTLTTRPVIMVYSKHYIFRLSLLLTLLLSVAVPFIAPLTPAEAAPLADPCVNSFNEDFDGGTYDPAWVWGGDPPTSIGGDTQLQFFDNDSDGFREALYIDLWLCAGDWSMVLQGNSTKWLQINRQSPLTVIYDSGAGSATITIPADDLYRLYLYVGNGSNGSSTDYNDLALSNNVTPTPTPTSGATATPTSGTPTATQFPTYTPACIVEVPTATRTPQRTPTPFSLTPTPRGSVTPGPTAVAPGFESELATFTESLAPWTVFNHNALTGGFVITLPLSMDIEHAPAPGDAIGIEHNLGIDLPSGSGGIITNTLLVSDALAYTGPNLQIPFPIRVSGLVRWSLPSIRAGENVYFTVGYLVKDGSTTKLKLAQGTGNAIRVQAFSSNFNVFIDDPQYPYAVGVVLLYDYEPNDSLHFIYEGLAVDDLKILAGQKAYTAGNSLPQCAGNGTGASNAGGETLKVCYAKITVVDVYQKYCAWPTSLLDIGGVLQTLWCRLWTYFKWVTPENSNQFADWRARQQASEPFGTLSEIDDGLSHAAGVLIDLQAQNDTLPQSPLDWAHVIDGSQLDTLTNFNLTIPTTHNIEYLNACPASIFSFSATAADGACFTLYQLRQTPVVAMLQWFLNGIFVLVLLRLASNMLKGIAA
jgi:hypothetical protein